MGHRVRRPEDDDRATRPSHPPLSYPRNRKRQLPLQEQLGESSQTRKGETSKLDERLTPKPSSSRVSSRWKLRVKSQRKSTVFHRGIAKDDLILIKFWIFSSPVMTAYFIDTLSSRRTTIPLTRNGDSPAIK